MTELRVFAVTQPIGTFYIGAMTAPDVCRIAHADVRRLIDEDRDVERYLGIERRLDRGRRIELEDYVNTVDATFPTAIILAVDEQCATLEGDVLRLTAYVDADEPSNSIPEERIAKVLDGQHRIAGLMVAKERFDVNVAIFIGADIADQATIFATVNLTQTKVNRSLAYDLFEYEHHRSPQKTCHNITVTLDQEPASPLYHRIKRLGMKTEGRVEEEFISQANFVNSLLPHITANPMSDRDAQRRGAPSTTVSAAEAQRFVFRRPYLDDRDAVIANVLWNFFDAVRDRWPRAWANQEPGWILTRTNGFRALMRFLRPTYIALGGLESDNIKYEQWRDLLATIQFPPDRFTTATYPPGTSGETLLYKDLVSAANIAESGRRG